MRYLYGSQIPNGAVNVQIRPVFGRGNTQALYQGAIEENGVLLDESKVSARVASNTGFWDYIDASKRGGREVGTCDAGIYSWRLSITFLDSTGAAACVDGKTSVLTGEAFEFYRAAASGESKDSSVSTLAQSIEKLVSAQTKLLAELGANLADNAQKASAAAVAAAMAPLSHLTDRLCEMSKEEKGRADEMTKVALKLMREQQPKPDVFDGIAKVAPAAVMGLKALKDLKN